MRLLILFLLLCCQNVFAQTVKTEAEKINREKFKGKVKEIKTYVYNNLQLTTSDVTMELKKGRKNLFTTMNYDKDGYLTKLIIPRPYKMIKGVRVPQGASKTFEYTHYDNGKLKQEIQSSKEGKWKETTIQDYFYDKEGRISKITKQEKLQREVGNIQILTYKYSSAKIQVFDQNRQLHQVEYLDSLNRMIKMVDYLNGNPVYFKEYDYIYRESEGKIVRVITKYRNQYRRGQYVYDDKGERLDDLHLDGIKKKKYKPAISSDEYSKKYKNEKIESEGNTYFYRIDKETSEKFLTYKYVCFYDEKENLIKQYTFRNASKRQIGEQIWEYEITYRKD